MTIKYTATFSDGTVVKRTTKSNRVYTHCWRITGAYTQAYIDSFSDNVSEYKEQMRQGYDASGFCGSLALAQKALAASAGYPQHATRKTEIAPAVVVS